MSTLWRVGNDYAGTPLDPSECDADPIVEVERWMAAAIAEKVPTPNAATLATVDERGRPAARIVLVKDIAASGVSFFTNYDSRKGRDLAAHPFAALVLFWEPLHRQVRIEGRVERLSAADSDAYFNSRPLGSRIGAIASPQSQVISKDDLVARVTEVTAAGPPVRPPHWGGFRVVPDMIELWQGQPSRLHDRVRYRLDSGTWTKDRLAP